MSRAYRYVRTYVWWLRLSCEVVVLVIHPRTRDAMMQVIQRANAEHDAQEVLP